MQYAWNLDLNTSFTGEDDLYVGIETGNAAAPLEMDSANGVLQYTTSNSRPLAEMFMEHKGEDIYIVLGGCRYGEALDIADAFTKSPYVEDDGVVEHSPHGIGAGDIPGIQI